MDSKYRPRLIVENVTSLAYRFVLVKEALDNFSVISHFFPKLIVIFIPLEGCAYMLWTYLNSYLQLQYSYKLKGFFSFIGHFKKSTKTRGPN